MTKVTHAQGIDAHMKAIDRRSFLYGAAALSAGGIASSLLPGQAWAEGPKKGGILKAGLQGGGTTDSLDPASYTGQVQFHVSRIWGDYLLRIKADGSLANLVAEEVKPSADAKTWTIKIRKGVEFHNGKTLTPDDVIATVERHAGQDSKSAIVGMLSGITTMKADGDEVIFGLKEPNADFPYLLADYHLVLQPGGGKDAPDAANGCGPYKLTGHQPGISYEGERFANYWQGDRTAHADQVQILVINDNTARTSALQSGQVDFINQISPNVVELLRKTGVTIRNISGRGFYEFGMFCDTPPFDNNDLRMALKLAIDREQIVKNILRGFGSVGNDFPINKVYPLFSDDIEQRKFDPEAAAKAYKKSGHSGSILLKTANAAFPGAIEAAELFQNSCAQCGIKIDVQRVPDDGYWTSVWNKEPFTANFWGGARPTQDLEYATIYSSESSWNDIRWRRPDFDKMILAARGELDQEKRKKIYRDMAIMMRDEGGIILPCFNDFIDATAKRVGGYEDDPNGELMNGYALIDCWVEA